MCNAGSEEDIIHLFFDCPFARSCWQALQIQWTADNELCSKLINSRTINAHMLFMDIFLIASWEIWKLRNDKIFNQGIPTRTRWIFNIKKQVHLQLLRVKETLYPQIVQWIDTIL